MKIQWECSGSAGKSATRDVPQQPSTHSSTQQPGIMHDAWNSKSIPNWPCMKGRILTSMSLFHKPSINIYCRFKLKSQLHIYGQQAK